jgi:hypothetical protein
LYCKQLYYFSKRVQGEPIMTKSRMLRTILLSTVFALLAIVLLASTASAHRATPAQGATTSQIPAAVPNVNIVREGGRSVFSATTVHCKARGLQNACFTITNLTQKTQQVIWKGKVLATIPPGAIAGLGTDGPNMTFFTLHANPQAILIAIAS